MIANLEDDYDGFDGYSEADYYGDYKDLEDTKVRCQRTKNSWGCMQRMMSWQSGQHLQIHHPMHSTWQRLQIVFNPIGKTNPGAEIDFIPHPRRRAIQIPRCPWGTGSSASCSPNRDNQPSQSITLIYTELHFPILTRTLACSLKRERRSRGNVSDEICDKNHLLLYCQALQSTPAGVL